MNKLQFWFIVVILVFNTFFGKSQLLSPVGLGWAKNSINAPVFRKNSVVSFKGNQYVSYYDSTGYVVLAKRKLGTNNWVLLKTQHNADVTDAHRSISLGIDGDGFLHLSWGHHNTGLKYCKSTNPESLTMGAASSMIGTLENDVTYPEFYKLNNGNMVFMYRYGVSGNGNLVVNSYDKTSQTWKRLHNVLIDGQGLRNAYWQTCIDYSGALHVSWVWRETSDVATNHDLCYAKSTDGGVTWKKSTGVNYIIPITISTAEQIKSIPQKSELINQTSMYVDKLGMPYIASYWKESGAVAPQYYVVYKDVTGWKTKQASNRTTNFSLSGSGTKKIPISRPQIVVDDRNNKPKIFLVYRDVEKDSRVSVNVNYDINTEKWINYDLSGFSVNSWEPSLDSELWRDSTILNVFVQKMGQGDGETLENLPAQMVYIAAFPKNISAVDSFDLKPIVTQVDILYEKNALVSVYQDFNGDDDIYINGLQGPVELTLLNSIGQVVDIKKINKPIFTYNLNGHVKGVYVLKIEGQETRFSCRIVLN